jgi:hypothetical protein
MGVVEVVALFARTVCMLESDVLIGMGGVFRDFGDFGRWIEKAIASSLLSSSPCPSVLSSSTLGIF